MKSLIVVLALVCLVCAADLEMPRKHRLLEKRQKDKAPAGTSAAGKSADEVNEGNGPANPANSFGPNHVGQISVQYAQGFQEPGKRSASQALVYHRGSILTRINVNPVFQGPAWGNPAFAADKITGIPQLVADLNGTTYMKVLNQYASGTAWATNHLYTFPSRVDVSAAPGSFSSTNINTQANGVFNYLCSVLGTTTRGSADFFSVFSDVPRGNAGWCAWHASGNCGHGTFIFGFHYNMDSDSGCEIGSASGGHSQGLTNLGNVFTHEMVESLNDPFGNAWYDSQGNEISDKCAWLPSTIAVNSGHHWTLQGQWSNSAYSARSGSGSAHGCVWTS